MNIEASIRSILLKKTVQTIYFDRRRGLECVKTENTKNILPLILDGITTAKEPKTNTNKELELEEEKEVVEMVEIII
ncbi:hypothetical protein CWI39_1926p0020 [Hamiltosporidium magnivora]|uniref:Uncharacterized protein n=1 Tax=Hamiltosporidium magnivora TaxID=148818 RepID=A0A4Q9KXM8_9MICR|nr:hypothetical protein CWI39_1926p0020 [Hamiltosporidium magnivora]